MAAVSEPPDLRTFAGVAVRGLGRLYDDDYALVDLEARFPAGSATALLGPNGAGKSTLIGILSTRLRASEGEAWFFGHRLDAPGPRVRAEIGYLGHRTMVYSELSALENLLFFGRLYGVADLDVRATALLERVGLGRDLHRPVGGFSRGMTQRLALARVLLPAPRLLLLDEPLTGLDQSGIALALELFAEARRGGAVLVMASHDLPATGEVCDRALVLMRGRKRFEGPFEGDLGDLYHRSLQSASVQ